MVHTGGYANWLSNQRRQRVRSSPDVRMDRHEVLPGGGYRESPSGSRLLRVVATLHSALATKVVMGMLSQRQQCVKVRPIRSFLRWSRLLAYRVPPSSPNRLGPVSTHS